MSLSALLTVEGVSLGYLMISEDGVWDKGGGWVNVAPARAEAHNSEISRSLLRAIDRCCVGMGCMSFWGWSVQTRSLEIRCWTGELISDDVTRYIGPAPALIFQRKGMTFKGRVGREAEAFYFRRVA